MKTTGKKIGLFGGTFDPVHIGHVIIAGSILEQKNLDSVIFIPSAHPPHKDYTLMFSPDDRFRMISMAVQDDPRFAVSDIELQRAGPSYTIDTIHEIKETLPSGTDMSFILGMDNLHELSLWKDPHNIVRECGLLVARRVCDQDREIPDWLKNYVEIVDVPLIEISSSDIRKRIKNGKNIRYLVPDSVLDEIEKLIRKI
ncbi:nicotinate-nucleotide adenylyltransferase [Candidatus Latescibacterota bacterium]